MKKLAPHLLVFLIGLAYLASIFEHRRERNILTAISRKSQEQTRHALDQSDIIVGLVEFWRQKYLECVDGLPSNSEVVSK